MPNIIEQQDLLKNLPDARLATLLQNPVADIPPFLVAAEAQRRQSIRQQFAGSENSESVVDTLTKQIAKVPQNIQPQAQTPPMIPPTPQMQGVAALQQQQAIQDIAQQAQPQQQMRHGGMVQRYYDGGTVKPWWEIPDISSTFSGAGSYIGSKVSELADWATKPYSERKAEEDSSEPGIVDKASIPPLPPGAASGMSFTPALPKEQTGKPEPLSAEAPPPPEPGETKDEYRARIEALFADRGTSSWERAQKWFSMAEKFFDPSLTTGQSIAAAGAAFAGSAGEQARADRELAIAREKALLEYDISERDRIRAAEADKAQREYETQQKIIERQTPTADATINSLVRSIGEINDQIAEASKTDFPGEPLPPEKQEKINRLIEQKRGLNNMMISIIGRGNLLNRKTVTEEELASLGIK